MIGLVDRGVDVVTTSYDILPALNDANNARAELYDRLISDEGVQIVIAGGNSGPGVNTVTEPSLATDVIAVGSSISKATWQSNYGSTVSSTVNLHTFSSRGPREDGGLKPNVVAPGSAISTVPRWSTSGAVAEAGYTLPPGYAHQDGTAMASAQTAGGVALLLSAAKAKAITVTPRALRDALYTTALPLPGVSTAGQGAGLISTPLAWVVLAQAKAGADGVKRAPVGQDYQVTAPVCTSLSGFLRTPNTGTGLYNRCSPAAGGQVLNTAKAYALTLRRTTGAATAVKHNVRLIGDDAKVYTVPSSATLGLNTPVTLNVSALMKAQGLGSAVLVVDDPATLVVDLRIPLNVVQAAAPVASVASLAGSVQRNQHTSLFVDVPAGTRALQVDLSGLGTRSHTRFLAVDPYGVPQEATGSLNCYATFSNPAGCNPTSRTYTDPRPGVWEFTVDARRTSPLLDNPFRLSVGQQSVSVTPAVQTLPAVTQTQPVPLNWTVTNTGAAATVTPRGGPLASAVTRRPSIADLQSQQYPIAVPPGATLLRVKIGNPADAGADLDLFLYRCNPSCVLVAQSAGGTAEETVSLTNPEAANYVVLVDAYAVPAGSTQYDYVDAYVSPALGSLSVDGTPRTLGSGASAVVSGTLTATGQPGNDRKLRGTLEVVNPGGALLGSAVVDILSVSS